MDGRYAEGFAQLAQQLHAVQGTNATVDEVITGGLRMVGCDMASVMLVHGRKQVEVAAVTDPLAGKADQLQFETGEGPRLSGLRDGDSFVVEDTRVDERWPQWSRGVAELGLRSVLSVRLRTVESTLGALNLYAVEPDRFDGDDLAVAHILARHAGVALAAARNESTLWQAADARKVIGQAQGILMERFDLDADQAFAVLRRYSQSNNIKLRVVSERLISTRQLPG